MAFLDSLQPDQRAVIQMVLGGRSYDQIAAMLRIDRASVRRRALEGFDALGPGNSIPAPRRALLTDYLLGQLPPKVADSVREQLGSSPPDRAWARVISAQIGPLSASPLPEIPVGFSWRQSGTEVGGGQVELIGGAVPGLDAPSIERDREDDHAHSDVQVADPDDTDLDDTSLDDTYIAAPELDENLFGGPGGPDREVIASEPGWAELAAEVAAQEDGDIDGSGSDGGGGSGAGGGPTEGDGAVEPAPDRAESARRAPSSRAPGSSKPPAIQTFGRAPRRSSRRGGAVLLALLAAVVVVVAVILLSSGGHPSKPAKKPVSVVKAHVVYQLDLYSPVGDKTRTGLAEVIKDGKSLTLVIVAAGIPANTAANAYAVWLYNSPASEQLLGFDDTRVGTTHRLQIETPVTAADKVYKNLLITIETQTSPKVPGDVILQGAFAL
jgi:hypothetical protein